MNNQSNAIRAELLRLSKENGGILQPRAVVDAARSPQSPLHSKFEWDDTKAAEEYRLAQARQLIRVTVQMIPTSRGDISEHVFVSLKTDREIDGGGYRQLVEVLSDSQMRDQLLAEALEEMKRFQEKYANLKELAEVFGSMRKVGKKKAA